MTKNKYKKMMETDLQQLIEDLKKDIQKILSVLEKYPKSPDRTLSADALRQDHGLTRKEVREEIESYLDGLTDEVSDIRYRSRTFANIFSNTMLLLLLFFLMKIRSLQFR